LIWHIKLDILVMAAHPDDAELSCSGTILSYLAQGKKVGIVDFTRGEMGTRGTPEIRLQESNEATKILGLHVQRKFRIGGRFLSKMIQASQLTLMEVIRRYQTRNCISQRTRR
jgi:N-acetylglucosamine malate deacetylase 1